MKICVAQTLPVKGDIQADLDDHKKLIALAVSNAADMIIFPELSLTGYEPELAKELAMDREDSRLDCLQKISDSDNITIGVGMPLKSGSGTLISMIIFQPREPRRTYSKQYLHEDEFPYFVSGHDQVILTGNKNKVSLAICYELSVPEHSEHVHNSGANIYIASVAKTTAGLEKAFKSLSAIARKYSMTVLLSNCIGRCDNFECGGQTAIWNNKGSLLARLNDTNEGILIIDTETQAIIERLPPIVTLDPYF